ncbi:hypothetical protein RJ641_014093 [Dillenia turbinata]|uniref:Uncharacterized protein n=1 Tax=Dillenia turbinata TaxID=194707 RepID=A0AAN8WB66_9MAGN
MSSIFHNFQKGGLGGNQSLPLSQADQPQPSLRRRLSSLSLKIQPISAPASSWVIRRTKSVSAMGEQAGGSMRIWWDWGWAWIMSRKPTFAKDLEMNEEETAVLGCRNKGSWRHVFYKVRSELRRLMGSDRVGLPQTYRYDSHNYSKNFDDGKATIQG